MSKNSVTRSLRYTCRIEPVAHQVAR
jgi:hypothetical protein